MLASLLVVLPVFGLIGLGYLARLSRLLRETTGEGLSDFVFVLAVPCLLFRTLAKADIPATQPWGYWIAYFGGLAVVWMLAMLVASRGFGRKGPELVVSGFAAAQSNTVFVGVPMILKAYGDAGAVPLGLLLAVHLPVTMTVATLLAEGRSASIAMLVRRLFTHPIIIGIILGSIVRPFVAQVPQPFWTLVDLLAGAAVPCALISLGIAMRRYGLESGLALPTILSGLKLGLHPLLVYWLATRIFEMPAHWSGVAVLFAACPCGINAYLFAERYRQGVADASSAITLSTLLSLFTTAAWLTFLGVG
ncbi:MAG: AEC family transporter [Bosea sp.]|uniref:AEC family transporter n=1 Tax=unclassified Bosea (in: a-proteobacteria) TaxID=2653178 RepID=UPI00095BBDD5|nr:MULTISPECIES: AEC family transporter [unclassified Bosea (in: a-proteobacteria)]MBN9444021.1 AEC family transporter [Bosea sp. (in: a-proteobacteria)]MBN9459441.1 AEC family transporter [Bosea sp. (in: a-proteobacteria)]OJV07507.1 MAG: transporter [Bosea sp. 67-29]